jgi:hypothetical protein
MPRVPKVIAQPAQAIESGSESGSEIEVPVIKKPRKEKVETLADVSPEPKPEPKKPGNKRSESYVLTDARKAQFEKARIARNQKAAIQKAQKEAEKRRWKQ